MEDKEMTLLQLAIELHEGTHGNYRMSNGIFAGSGNVTASNLKMILDDLLMLYGYASRNFIPTNGIENGIFEKDGKI